MALRLGPGRCLAYLFRVGLAAVCVALVCMASLRGDDWPMWRFDAHRSAACDNRLSSDLRLQWTKQLGPQRQQAWDDPLNLDLMTYDRLFEPIVMDGRLFVAYNDSDKVVAIDTRSGQEVWKFFTEAPVRLPPAGWNERVFFCSDDGFLYCVHAQDGRLLWKYQAAPSAQHAIGNRRLTSAWPARGGPVVRDGTVYFAASIWPFMGTFVVALDAETGEVRWVNDRTGAQYIKQPHSAPSFAGVAPQGALVATENELIVPGGRSVPAVFERADGRLRYFELNEGGKGTGGSFVAADEQNFYVHTREKGTRAFDLERGVKTAFMPNEPVLLDGLVISAEFQDGAAVIRAYNTAGQPQWEIAADGRGDLIKAGSYLVAAGDQMISIIELPREMSASNTAEAAGVNSNDPVTPQQPAVVVQQLPVESPVERLLVADGKLFAVCSTGQLLAFGAGPAGDAIALTRQPEASAEQVENLPSDQSIGHLLDAGAAEGYAFWFGSPQRPEFESLLAESPFEQLAVVDQNSARVDELRHRLDAVGKYGKITVHLSQADQFLPPQYVANMVFVNWDGIGPTADTSTDKLPLLAKLYAAVRPYGGRMHVLLDKTRWDAQARAELASAIQQLDLEQAEVVDHESGISIARVGALPGSADWTHQYGDIANTIKSDDARVKLPLGVLWFGGSSHMDVLPRHGHGPPEQVVGGRLFIQGMNSLSARDVYTGRVLWKREFEDLGTFDVYYDETYEDVPLDPKYNQVHIPGANGRGTNYVVTEDRVYILEANVCHALDPATGETLHDFHLPTTEDGEQESWGYIGVYQDVLIGGLGFAEYRQRNGLQFEADKELSRSKAGFGSKSFDRAASVALVGFNRHSGQQLWKVDANHSFWHNGIVAGGGKIYCLDKNPQPVEDALRRRGQAPPDSYRIVALDFRTGESIWEVKENIFGTWLGYSDEFDLLLQAGAKGSDRLAVETGQGMAVYAASSGSLQWHNDDLDYAGPCILHHDLIITNANSYKDSAGAFYLRTGKQKMVKHPLTGELQPWKVTRAYGCNSIIASENMLTFRSGAAGFYDLLSDSGTGNLGGFKSGCTSNLVVANGVLNAPDYTRTCSCAYQNQTSLALVHMPDVDLWSINTLAAEDVHGQHIREVGINFGAPGDRRDASGLLWVEHPVVSEPSPPLKIALNPEARTFQYHTSSMYQFSNLAEPWITASGIEGVTEMRLSMRLHPEKDAADEPTAIEPSRTTRKYRLRLFCAIPAQMSGVREFDVYANNQLVEAGVLLDPTDKTGPAVREIRIEDVTIGEELTLRFDAKRGQPLLGGIQLVETSGQLK